MKYYKLLGKAGYISREWVVGKIYPGIFSPSDVPGCAPVCDLAKEYSKMWEEVFPKYQVGDVLEIKRGGYEHIAIEQYNAMSYLKTRNGRGSAKCKEVRFSSRHQEWFYKLKGYGNYISEGGLQKQEEFTFPDKWGIKFTEENRATLGRRIESHEDFDKDFNDFAGYCVSKHPFDKSYQYYGGALMTGYEEITFEQFKKYVLKQEAIMGKQVIGYGFLYPGDEKIIQAIEKVTNGGIQESSFKNYGNILSLERYPQSIQRLKEVGLLDIWFKPVYKEVKTLPKINGSQGEKIDQNTVKYGCAYLKVDRLDKILDVEELSSNRDIKSITLNSGVSISMEEIKQVVDYFKE